MVVVDDLVEGFAVVWSRGDIGVPEFMIGGGDLPEIFRVLEFPVVRFEFHGRRVSVGDRCVWTSSGWSSCKEKLRRLRIGCFSSYNSSAALYEPHTKAACMIGPMQATAFLHRSETAKPDAMPRDGGGCICVIICQSLPSHLSNGKVDLLQCKVASSVVS